MGERRKERASVGEKETSLCQFFLLNALACIISFNHPLCSGGKIFPPCFIF